MLYLMVWHRAIKRRRQTDDLATVFDHGPIFRLALLREFGPEITRSKLFGRWWRTWLRRWMATLDAVVWVDAPDEVLVSRLRQRGHRFLAAGASDLEMQVFLDRYRTAFEKILASSPNSPPRVMRFRSDEGSVDAIASEVLTGLGTAPS